MIATTKTETAVVASGRTATPIKQALLAMLVLLSVVTAVATASSSAEAHHSGYIGWVNVDGTSKYKIRVCVYNDFGAAPACALTNPSTGDVQFWLPSGHNYRIVADYWLNNQGGAYMGTWQWSWFSVARGQVVYHKIY